MFNLENANFFDSDYFSYESNPCFAELIRQIFLRVDIPVRRSRLSGVG